MSDSSHISSVAYRGKLSRIQDLASGLARGTLISGFGYVLAWKITGENGGLARLEVSCANQSAADHDGNAAITDVWSCTTSRVDLPVEAYCGISQGASAWLYDIQRWRQEPEQGLHAAFQYTDGSGTVQTLSALSKLVAQKILAGEEAVMRGHPTIRRARTYAAFPDCAVALYHIDTPPNDDLAAKAASWLKVQDDASQNADGTWTRTESWMGADSWDVNFYGSGAAAMTASGRWPFGYVSNA